MKELKEYLRTIPEFETAYNDLKNACRKFNPYLDSINLTSKKIDPAFGVPINKDFDLLVDKTFDKMKIVFSMEES